MVEIRVRRTPPEGLGPMLRQARERAGLGLRETARSAGVAHSYLYALEAGTRCPSLTTAGHVADALRLDALERELLLATAVDDAGADSPWRRAAAS